MDLALVVLEVFVGASSALKLILVDAFGFGFLT
jgi:hypothetical protein